MRLSTCYCSTTTITSPPPTEQIYPVGHNNVGRLSVSAWWVVGLLLYGVVWVCGVLGLLFLFDFVVGVPELLSGGGW